MDNTTTTVSTPWTPEDRIRAIILVIVMATNAGTWVALAALSWISGMA